MFGCAGKDGKQFGVPLEPQPFLDHIKGLLEDIHNNILLQATTFRDENIVDVQTFEDLKSVIAEGIDCFVVEFYMT